MTRSKGPAEELSLPPTRMRKDVPTPNEGTEDTPEVQANVQSRQRTTDTPSLFARPGSRAGTSTTPASEAGMLPAASTPFAWPDSRAGLVPQKPTSPQSSLSSTSNQQMQEDENTSVSWDLVDTDTDAEVANINLAPTHQTVTNQNCADSINKMQNNAVGLNHELNTFYNQDFFVADTMGRRLSQIVHKSNYSSLLPNGNAALQLRLPDLLIYLKTDRYLVDVKTGHHYAVYHNHIEKMSVLPKLYAAWPYRQLLQAIHDDAVRFGVNSPEPDTSKQSAPAMQPSTSIDRDVPAEQEQQPSPRKPTVVKYELPSFNLQMPKKMHMAAANAAFTKVAILEGLNAAGTQQRCSLQGGTAYTEKSTHTSCHKTSAYARGRQRIQTHSRTTSVRPARTFVDSEKHGHNPRQGATLHGDIYRSRSIMPTAKR